jgi:hypothetical protein
VKRISWTSALVAGAFLLWQSPPRTNAAETTKPQRLIPVAAAASSAAGRDSRAEQAMDGDPKTRWSSRATDHESLTLDLGTEQVIGEVALLWEAACAEVYQIQVSADDKTWHVVFTEIAGGPGEKRITFEPVSARYVRMQGIKRKTKWGYSLFSFDVIPSSGNPAPLAKYPTPEEIRFDRKELRPRSYYLVEASGARPGSYPLWLDSQQVYWTITGTADGTAESLLAEDGTVELYPRAWSLMPYLLVGGRLISARDVELSQSLADGYLPIPSVEWKTGSLVFRQTLFTWGEGGRDISYALYTIENQGTGKQAGALFLTLRPFQVTPPWQGDGGMTDIFSVRTRYGADHSSVLVNETQLLYCVTAPDAAGAVSFQGGDVLDYIPKGNVPPLVTAFDPWGGATAALRYDFALAPGEKAEYLLAAPLTGGYPAATPTAAEVHEALSKTRSFWEKELNRVRIELPDPYPFNVLRANLAYLLINRDGPALQAGSRNYERSWIRDGSLMGIALLRTGHPEEAAAYIRWIADHQLLSGDVPCMINADGSQWDWGKTLLEYDGQGAFVTLVAEYDAYTKDRVLVNDVFTNVTRALEFLDSLRKKRLTDEFRAATDERARFYGILPLSVSHEGYTAPGKHSYWDDFWALGGWREGQSLAKLVGRDDLVPWMSGEESGLRSNLLVSIRKTQEAKGISTIPGCAELGERDATSTTIALWPTEEYLHLPREQVVETLDGYYRHTFLPRLKPDKDPHGKALPYEMRNVTAALILGQKQRAWEMFDYFLQCTRPHAWCEWGEVIYVDYRNPDYIGDMPHSWGGADYIHALRTAFLLESEDSLKLGLGIREEWLPDGGKIAISDAPTHYGNISYAVARNGSNLRVQVEGRGKAPPKGYLLVSPLAARIRQVMVNGQEWQDFNGETVHFSALPADIAIAY